MRVTIHQPNYLPWLGFFDKMAKADLFVLLDNVPYTKGGYQNRVQVRGPAGPQWLTVPVVSAGRLGQRTNETQIDAHRPWRRIHARTLDTLYGKAPRYPALKPAIDAMYERDTKSLVEFCSFGIDWIRRELGIKTPVLMASSLGVEGDSSALLLDITTKVGASCYLSGPSGRAYLDEAAFRSNGIEVEYHAYRQMEYQQRFAPFLPGLSAIDFLLNGGGPE